MKKRIFSALMALCLAFSISGAAFAAPEDGPAMDATAGAPQTAAYTADANGAGSAGDGTGSAEGSSSSESTGSESSSPDSTPSSSEESKEEAVSSSSSSSESSSASSGSEVTSDSASSEVSSDSTIPESGSSSSQGERAPSGSEQQESATTTEQPSASNGGIDLLADSDRTIEVFETTQIQGSTINLALRVGHEWSVVDNEGVVQLSKTDERTVTVKGIKPGTVTLRHRYKRAVGGDWQEEYFTVTVSDKVTVYVYVSSKDSQGNSWLNNAEFLDLIGLEVADDNGFFPAGIIQLDASFLEGKENSKALINSDEDWNELMESLSVLDTTQIVDEWNKEYSLNQDNTVNNYIAQAEKIFGQTSGSGHTALFPWDSSPKNQGGDGPSYGFEDQSVRYHLDLCFNTNTITFVVGNTDINQQGYHQGDTVAERVYIRGSEIREPQNIGAPDGYTIEGYYTDSGCTTEWQYDGQRLDSDQTVYIKYVEREHVTINYNTVGLDEEDKENALSATSEHFNPAGAPTGVTVTVPNGYKFLGWYSDEACTTSVSTEENFIPDGVWEDGKTYDYYAKFEKLEPLDLDHQKYVKYNDDGTYDLTLNVTGDFEEGQTQTKEVDVLMIVDKSGSMGIVDSENHVINDNRGNIVRARDAMKLLISTLEGKNTTDKKLVDARYSVIAFSGSDTTQHGGSESDASLTADWQGSSNTLTNKIDGLRAKGGTDYEAALKLAKTQLAQAEATRPNSTKIVIFLSDGAPTWSLNGGWGNGNLDITSDEWDDTLNTARELTCDKFYAIAIGTNFSQYLSNVTYEGREEVYNPYGLVNAVNATTKDFLSVDSDYNSDDLSQIFADIANEAAGIDCTNVTITDTLSKYAQLTDDATFKISIKDENGTEVVSQEVNANNVSESGTQLTLTYWEDDAGNTTNKSPGKWEESHYTRHDIVFTLKKADKTFTLVFDPEYALELGWTYSITTQIEPTQTAINEYNTNVEAGKDGYGGNIGDANTDDPTLENPTSSEKPGFDSNTTATLTYTSNTVDTSKTYPVPVIQVPETGNLTIQKTVDGLPDGSDAQVAGAKFTFTIEGPASAYEKQPDGGYSIAGTTDKVSFTPVYDEEDSDKVIGSTVNDVEITGANSVTIVNLPAGTYTVTENTAAMGGIVDDYHFENATYMVGNEETKQAVLTASGSETVVVTNHYVHDDVTLTVKKTVGGGMGDTSPENKFDFTLTLTKDDKPYSLTLTEDQMKGLGLTAVDGQSGKYTFRLASGDEINITLPYEVKAEVEEADRSDYKEEVRKYATGTTLENQGNYNVGRQLAQTMDSNWTFDYMNSRDAVAPTGLESNHTAPYALMVTAAGVAGLALLGSMAARRRRRQE